MYQVNENVLEKQNDFNNMFNKIILDELPKNSFGEISKIIDFEKVLTGRVGRVLAMPYSEFVPLVRTTNCYDKPTKEFPLQLCLLSVLISDKIKQLNLKKLPENDDSLLVNNALAEIYDNEYHKMSFHTDQSQDLANDSHICVYSCYENDSNDPDDFRILRIRNKTTNKQFDIELENNSVVIFSTNINHKYKHKIILKSNKAKNRWLGLTFRKSKTFVRHHKGIPHIISEKQLKQLGFSMQDPDADRIKEEEKKVKFDITKYPELVFANTKQCIEIYKCKGLENRLTHFEYPERNFTLSKSDLLPVEKSLEIDD